MEVLLEEFSHLKHFTLKEIKSITGDFDVNNLIGEGGFGKVYKGVLSNCHGQTTVAFKRLDSNCGQGNPEFLKEIMMLSRYTHENLISLLGFCDEDGEKILVYEHTFYGSLDRYLGTTSLTWRQRLKICIAAATGLCYLHDPKETHERVIHRDIKSSNILLDENWNAKNSGMGLSKIGPANQQRTFLLVTNVVGTLGYVDPMYLETSILTKESDVYSFGVVLIEVLCGRLCFQYNDGNSHSLVRKWKQSYKQKKVDEIIFLDLKQRMDPSSLETFSDIAHRCLNKFRKDRPNMSEVVEKLKLALRLQETFEEVELSIFEDTGNTEHPPVNNEGNTTLVSSLEKKIDDTEKKYEETSKLSEERLKQALDAETKIIRLKTAMQSLEEKVSDMESENQILRQKAFSTSARIENILKLKMANGHFASEEPQTPARHLTTEFDSKAERPPINRQHENVDALIECVKKNIGFSQGKPVAAFTIYKCLIHWKSFEAERTSVFDRLIQMIRSTIEGQDNNEHMAYWLSNSSTLLFLLQRSIKSDGASSVRKPSPPTSLFGRITMGFRSSPSVVALEVVRQVEAKYPALLFKQQLIAYVEKMYGSIRDNLKKELGSFLTLCIQAPRATKGVLRSGWSSGKDSQSNQWQGIIDCLNTLLNTLKDNFVPPIILQKIFTQNFSYINVQLFNSLLLRRECCTFSNGEYVKAGLAELELWCCQAKEEYEGTAWDELKHIRQAVGFLVIDQKYRISYDEIIHDLCPILSVQQLYRICTLYWDANYNTRSLSPDVISSMRALMTEDSNSAASSSLLLDDESSIPFSVDDLSSSLQVKEFRDVKPALELIENTAFQFLRE